MRLCVAGAMVSDGFCTLSKVNQMCRFCSSRRTMASVGLLKRICKGAFRVAGAVQDTHIYPADMFRGQGANFLRQVAL